MENVNKANKVKSFNNVLVTGGTGKLGTALQNILKDAQFPTHSEFDIRNLESMLNYFTRNKHINTLIHCAALTSPPRIASKPIDALHVNIMGTANIVHLCNAYDVKLIYISTDYVYEDFPGIKNEESSLYPINQYAWSKLGGECCVQMYDKHIIVRTSFGPSPFPYKAAPIDQYTSREEVSVIAEKIASLLNYPSYTGTINVGGERRSVLEYATSISNVPIEKIKRKDMPCITPFDTSLDCTEYNDLVEGETNG